MRGSEKYLKKLGNDKKAQKFFLNLVDTYTFIENNKIYITMRQGNSTFLRVDGE